eukprot:TRINITY_DN5281_c0_g1_i1.p1 TRINITY_DN5281_c0_g1~~TRINITY_DN5281_c0_g1_i1.p1  ORF type:complete len:518 (-),score=66.95 TRINITY_DN5281_c0_g1_i1:801-2354(-)
MTLSFANLSSVLSASLSCQLPATSPKKFQTLFFLLLVLLTGSFSRGDSYPDLFELVPGRYNDTLSLPHVLSELPRSPEGEQFIINIINYIKETTGLSVPQYIINQILENFDGLLDYLAVTVSEVRSLIDYVNLLYREGLLSPRPPALEVVLPRVFPMDALEELNINLDMYQFPFEHIGPDLYQGYLNSSDDPQRLKNSIAFAEILQRLSKNYQNLSQDPTWMVEYNDNIYSRAEDLIMALNQSGHNVESYITCRVADFFGLWKKQGDKYFTIPVPLMIVTDIPEITNSTDPPRQVTIPSEHCELVLKIKPPPNPPANTKFWDLDLVWYEGTGSVGYIAKNLNTLTDWVGSVDRFHMNINQVMQAVKYSSMYTDILLQAQKEHQLYNLGYGATGSCTDTVGLIAFLVFEKPEVFPFVLKKEYLLPVVKERVSQCKDEELVKSYKIMYKAIESLPVDYAFSETSAWRIYSELPWSEGQEAFSCAIRARATLEQMIMKNITAPSNRKLHTYSNSKVIIRD